MKAEQLQAIKEQYDNMDWESFRENAGELITREIDIYNDVVIDGVPALIAEVERLNALLQKIGGDIAEHTAKTLRKLQ